jgi:DNA-binding CsgD family transcriptional regulator
MRVSSMAYGLVNRVEELKRLRELTRRAAAGQGATVLIEGEPGIGKTSLLDVVVAEATGLGLRVLRGSGAELERKLPFAAIMSALALPDADADAQLARLSGLLRGEGTALAGTADQEYMVAEAVLDLLDHWCATGPVALLVDDLQWSDPSSLLVLSRLGGAVRQLPLLLVLAYQPVPRPGELDSLLRRLHDRGAVAVPLGPLDEPAVARLVGQLTGAVPDDGLLARAAGAAGNPLYVTELIRAADQTDPVPRSLAAVVARRLDLLSTQARELLGVAAVLGTGFTLTELSTILGTPVIELWEATSEAVQAGLLAESGDKLVFRHDLIRESLAGNVPASVRDALLTQAGHALARAGAAGERVAELFAASGSLDTRTAEWLAANADRLILRAPDLAVDLLTRAVDRSSDWRARLRPQLARALLGTRRPRDAERIIEAALAVLPEPANAEQVATLRWLLAQACFQRGHLERAVAEARRALAVTDPATASAARLHGFLAQMRLLMGQVEAADASAASSLVAAQASGDAYGTAYGLYMEAGVRLLERRPSDGVLLSDQALAALGAREIQPDLQLAPHLTRGWCLLDLDRSAEADEAFERGLRQSERGSPAFVAWHHMGRATLRFLDGRWDDALAELDGALEVADPFGLAELLRDQATAIAMHRGDFSGADELLGRTQASPFTRYWDWQRLTGQALAWEHAGLQDQALRLLFEGLGTGWLLPPYRYFGVYAYLARLALVSDRTAELRPLLEAQSRLVEQHEADNVRAGAALCRGVVERDADLLLAAADGYRTAGWVLDEAYAYECAALVLGDQNRLAPARAAVNSALDRYERLDAAWDIGRAEGYLRQLGGRRRRAKPRPRTGWPALTATERKVAKFVAEGHSNPDIAEEMFLSRRTVQSHVSNILAKLGLASRVELAVSAYAQQAAD